MASTNSNPHCMNVNLDPFFSNYVHFDDSSIGCQDGLAADFPSINQEQLAAINSSTVPVEFSPSPPLKNPNLNQDFMNANYPFFNNNCFQDGGLMGSEPRSTESENNDDGQSALEKKRRYYRHTPEQIELLEETFKNCPNPDEKVRKRLSKELGLTTRQVKFWFQNRKTQMKARKDRHDIGMLRAEMAKMEEKYSVLHANYSKLQQSHLKLYTVLHNLRCTNCGGRPQPGQRSYEDPQPPLLQQNARRIEDYGEQSCYRPNMQQQSSYMQSQGI